MREIASMDKGQLEMESALQTTKEAVLLVSTKEMSSCLCPHSMIVSRVTTALVPQAAQHLEELRDVESVLSTLAAYLDAVGLQRALSLLNPLPFVGLARSQANANIREITADLKLLKLDPLFYVSKVGLFSGLNVRILWVTWTCRRTRWCRWTRLWPFLMLLDARSQIFSHSMFF